MKYLKLFIVLGFLIFASCGKKQNTPVLDEESISTYYFIRHAEKDRSDPTNKDPHLLDIGKQRAENWSQIFKNVHFDVVYSTDYNRTKETAQPTALRNHLKLSIYNPKTLDIQSFTKVNKGKNVLVVGHSNSTPELVNTILKQDKYPDIEDDNNSNLYIISLLGERIISDNLLYISH